MTPERTKRRRTRLGSRARLLSILANRGWLLAAAACLYFLSGPALPAQQGKANNDATASLRGMIKTKQADSQPSISGVTVKLTGEAAGSVLSADTDDDGKYEFRSLKPGSYALSIAQPGFKTITRTVILAAGQVLAQDFILELESVAEKVEVHDQSEAIATESVSAPNQEVSERQLEALPTTMQKVKEVLTITPGVIKTLDGKLSLRGSDENQSLLLVNSARTTDPVTGNFSVPIPPAAVQSFAVYKTPYNASLGGFSGGLTTVDTKPPTDQMHLQFRNIVPFILGKNGQVSGIGEATPGVEFGGPLFTKKVFYSEVFQYEMKKRTVRGLPYPGDISKRQGFNSFTTLEAILSNRQVLTLTVNAFPFRQQHYDINSLVPFGASNDLDQKGVAITLADKYQFESGGALSIVAQYMRFDSNAHGQGLDDMLISPEGWAGNYFNRWARRGKEFQFLPSYTFPEKDWKGRHQITTGVELNHRSYFGTSLSHPVQLLRADGTREGQVDFSGAALQDVSDTAVAEFVHDHWIMDQHWSLDAGARLSSETSGWSAAFAPRVGLSFSPDQDGRTVIRTGAGLFYSVLPLLAGNFAENPTRTVSVFDATGTTLIAPPITYTNAFVGSQDPLGPGVLPQKPGTTPRNFTWNAEVVHRLRSDLTLRAAYLESHTTYLFVANPFTAPPGANSFLGLTNRGSSRYHEAEFTGHYTFREHNEVNAAYVWSRTRGDLNSLASVLIPFEQPVIRPNVYGILPNDVPRRFITWGIFAVPWKMTFSPLVDVHTGQAYSNIDVLQNYVGTPNGQRYATFFSLDAKIYRDFKVPFLGSKNKKAHHVRLGFYSTNVTNYHNFHDVFNNVTAPNFGQFAGFLDRREGAVIDFID
jgi:carboxypeptidase family protein/TonB-dependent receptor-like protein